MLSGAVAGYLLQRVPWWDTKVVNVAGRIKLTQLFLCGTLYVRAKARGPFTIPDPLRRIVGKRLDHFSTLPTDVSNVKR